MHVFFVCIVEQMLENSVHYSGFNMVNRCVTYLLKALLIVPGRGTLCVSVSREDKQGCVELTCGIKEWRHFKSLYTANIEALWHTRLI